MTSYEGEGYIKITLTNKVDMVGGGLGSLAHDLYGALFF